MSFAIYIDQTIIRIIDSTGRNEPIQYNPAQTKYYIKDGKFIFYDGIEEQDFNNHGYQDFTDRDGNAFNTEADFIRYLNAFISSVGGATSYNPLPTYDIDLAGRTAATSIFGDRIVADRIPDVAAQFQYGFPASSAVPEIENGGYITIIESMLVLGTDINVAGRAKISNKKALRYVPGYEAFVFFTAVFSPAKADSVQRTGLFDDENGFFIGYEGVDFAVTRRRDGVDVNYVIDVSKVFEDGTFNPEFGNVYKISFGYLGFAAITFEVMRPDGGWKMFYKIEYPNSSTDTHITNTNLPPALEVFNSGNDTDIFVKAGSFSGGTTYGGGVDPASRKFSFSNNNIDIIPVYHLVFVFRSKETFFGIKNYIEALLVLLSIAADLSKDSVWEFRKDMTITNTPTWQDTDVDSIIEYSADATVTTDSGSLEFSLSLGKTQTLFEDVEKYVINLLPGETMAIIIKTPGGTNGTFNFSLRWKELF